MTRHVVASVGDIKPGEKKLVTVKGREVGVFNVGGEFFALANRCPHAGGPWHGWEFDIRTGQSWCDPEDFKVRKFKAEVAPGEELVKGPYIAEKFDVTVEENYVVIDM